MDILNKLKEETLNNKYLVTGYLLVIIGYSYSIMNLSYTLISIFIALTVLLNVIFCGLKIKERILFLLFNLTMTFFIISRPIIDIFTGLKWWEIGEHSLQANFFALNIIFISLITMTIGVMIYDSIKGTKKETFSSSTNRVFVTMHKKVSNIISIDKTIIQRISFVLFVISMSCFLYREVDKLVFMADKLYYQYYTLYTCELPFVVKFLAGMMVPSMCVFLATKPNKKITFIVLATFILSSLPMLKIGVRNIIILNCLFTFVYYFLRDVYKKPDEKKWIGKIEKVLIVLALPLSLLYMSNISNERLHIEQERSSTEAIVDFFYEQGTSFDVLRECYTWKDKLPDHSILNYTFGGYIDFFQYGKIGRVLFDSPDLGEGNNLQKVYLGNSLAHSLSYIILGDAYLSGSGRGSSYMLETYLDFGYVGLIIFNVLLGALLIGLVDIFKKNWLLVAMGLISITEIFFIPRASALGWSEFLISYYFWAVIGIVIVFGIVYKYIVKGSERQNENRKIPN